MCQIPSLNKVSLSFFCLIFQRLATVTQSKMKLPYVFVLVVVVALCWRWKTNYIGLEKKFEDDFNQLQGQCL